MAQPPAWHVVELWIGLEFIVLGAAALAALVLGAAAGAGWRLFLLASGKARWQHSSPPGRRPGKRPGRRVRNPPAEDATGPVTRVDLDGPLAAQNVGRQGRQQRQPGD